MRFCLGVIVLGWLICFQSLIVEGDVGTATTYDPPYLPTKCSGYSQDQFPEGNLFAAASDGIWDNGAACGRKYRIRCINGQKKPCKDGSVIVQIVDVCRHNPCPATLVLSTQAFSGISKNQNAKINVEYVGV